jgi:hypothetical protein
MEKTGYGAEKQETDCFVAERRAGKATGGGNVLLFAASPLRMVAGICF